MFYLLFLALTSTGQIALASNNPPDKTEAKRTNQSLISEPANSSTNAMDMQLRKLEKRTIELERKNDDLAKENEELKKSVLMLQINIKIQSNLQPVKPVLRDVAIENIVYDY
jgi:predicted RNase H-like nuclease (RuvC/YqgF family)